MDRILFGALIADTEYEAPFVCRAFSGIVHVPSFWFCWRSGTAFPSLAQSRFQVRVHTPHWWQSDFWSALRNLIRCLPKGCVRLGLYAPKARKASVCVCTYIYIQREREKKNKTKKHNYLFSFLYICIHIYIYIYDII